MDAAKHYKYSDLIYGRTEGIKADVEFVSATDYTALAERIAGLERDNESLRAECSNRATTADKRVMQVMQLEADLSRAQSELKAAREDAERLASALDPFVRFNSSEEKITLVVNTVYVRNGRKAIADYALKHDAARTPSAAQGGEKP